MVPLLPVRAKFKNVIFGGHFHRSAVLVLYVDEVFTIASDGYHSGCRYVSAVVTNVFRAVLISQTLRDNQHRDTSAKHPPGVEPDGQHVLAARLDERGCEVEFKRRVTMRPATHEFGRSANLRKRHRAVDIEKILLPVSVAGISKCLRCKPVPNISAWPSRLRIVDSRRLQCPIVRRIQLPPAVIIKSRLRVRDVRTRIAVGFSSPAPSSKTPHRHTQSLREIFVTQFIRDRRFHKDRPE